MKIVVCIKQVVDTDDIKWTKNNTIDRDGVESVINPCDMLALETALRIKDIDKSTHITAISMGPLQAQSALKTAIAMGCDEAYLLSDKKFSGADTVATSKALSSAIKFICPDFDLVICGQFASDGDTAQTGPSIAQKLGVEQITYVTELKPFEIPAFKIVAIRKADELVEVVEAPLPALICVAESPYLPRDIKIDGYITAQNYDVKILSAEQIGLDASCVGIKGSPTWVSRAFRAVNNRENIILKDLEIIDVVKILSSSISEMKGEDFTGGDYERG